MLLSSDKTVGKGPFLWTVTGTVTGIKKNALLFIYMSTYCYAFHTSDYVYWGYIWVGALSEKLSVPTTTI